MKNSSRCCGDPGGARQPAAGSMATDTTVSGFTKSTAGRVASGQSVNVVYAGQPLRSHQSCVWKVRVWDQSRKPSGWSAPASWTMGLLEAGDWQAKWIGDAEALRLATAAPVGGPHNGYHSELAKSADEVKWVAIDLGDSRTLEGFRLFPARPYDWQPDTPGFLFPLRFKIEVAQRADFSDARVVVDQTQADQPNPGTNGVVFTIAPTDARYVRLEATRLRVRSGSDYGLALAEMEVLSHGTNIARGAAVTRSHGGEGRIGERVPGGYVYIDGSGVGDVGPAVLREREVLGRDGFVIAILHRDPDTGELIDQPEIISKGFIHPEDGEDVLSGATDIVTRLSSDASLTDKALQDRIKDKLSEYVYHETKRRPMIIPVLS